MGSSIQGTNKGIVVPVGVEKQGFGSISGGCLDTTPFNAGISAEQGKSSFNFTERHRPLVETDPCLRD